MHIFADFSIKIIDMNYIITGKIYPSPLIKSFEKKDNIVVMSDTDLKNSDIVFSDDDKIYCPDETSVPFLKEKVSKNRWNDLETIKNKNQCRILLKDLYPDFFFTSVKLDDLPHIHLPEGKSFIIKPQKGFFGVGVRKIDKKTDLKEISNDIKQEIINNLGHFSDDIFTQNDFIIEEFIEGEEYSFDLFYNEESKPVFTSMCRHPESKHPEYFHLLYYTSKEIYDKYYDQAVQIFTEFNKTLNLKNIPIHAEFRSKNGRLMPIEFNVPRFGGFGLGDLPFYAFGENPYEHFFNGTNPDWKNIFEKNKDKYFGWVLCYNGKNADLNKQVPDYKKLKADLGKVLFLNEMDYKNNPVFAVAYIEMNSKKEIDRILSIDFDDYFRYV